MKTVIRRPLSTVSCLWSISHCQHSSNTNIKLQ